MACELHLHFPSIKDASQIVDLTHLLATVTNIEQEIKNMSAEMQKLVTAVTGLKAADEGIIKVLGNISQQIRDNVDDKAAMLSLADDVDGEKAKVSDAILANTPAAPSAPAASAV